MGAPLILSMNVRNLSAYDLETYSNAGAIAVNQDALVQQGVRIQGYNLTSTDVPTKHPGKWKATVLTDYNIVRGQCEACKQSPTGCCTNRSKPNVLVQYLSHSGAKTLGDCESLCHGFARAKTSASSCDSASSARSFNLAVCAAHLSLCTRAGARSRPYPATIGAHVPTSV